MEIVLSWTVTVLSSSRKAWEISKWNSTGVTVNKYPPEKGTPSTVIIY